MKLWKKLHIVNSKKQCEKNYIWELFASDRVILLVKKKLICSMEDLR